MRLKRSHVSFDEMYILRTPARLSLRDLVSEKMAKAYTRRVPRTNILIAVVESAVGTMAFFQRPTISRGLP